MKHIAIIGAGISGMSIAQILKNKFCITIFEKEEAPGGLIRCNRINGHLFHLTGGHVFNTKRQEILDWFWQYFDKEEEFTKADRNSVVIMPDDRIIQYPIENHAYQFSDNMMKSFINDLITMASKDKPEPKNFEDFLRNRFGETLYREYFQPYNEKIWKRSLSHVPLSWLEGKLPMPTLQEILYNNFNHVEEKEFVHSSFYYPRKDGSQFIANRLAQNLNIKYNTYINSIEKKNDYWVINNECFDKVIFCGNIKDLPILLKGINISQFIDEINKLEYHGTTTVLCEIENNPFSWIYMPSQEFQAHRIICTGNFALSNRTNENMSATIEFTDEIDKKEILCNLSKIPYKPKYIAHNYAKYTYPIQASETRILIQRIKSVLEKDNLYLLGRFAEWEYYNMDAAIGAAIKLSEQL
mgnify:CR=1 FL=1